MKHLLLLLAIQSVSCICLSQHNFELYNSGATIFVSAGADVHVRGDVHMIGGTLTNNGQIETQGNSYSNNTFQQRGTGTYLIRNNVVNGGERQFISGSYAVRGGQSQIGVNDGSFYNLVLDNDQGFVYLVGAGNVADYRNTVDFNNSGLTNTVITHDVGLTGAIVYPANGSAYTGVFGNMNTTAGLAGEVDNTVSVNGNISGVDNGYVIGKQRRAINAAGGIYGYVLGLEPAGAGAQRGVQYVHLNFAANNYDVIEGYFESGSDNTIPGTTTECTGENVDYFGGADHGEWVFNDITGTGAGTYEIMVWPQDDNFPIETIWIVTKDNAIAGTADQCGPSPVGLARGGMNGFSEFGVAAVLSPLPVEFLNISAEGITDHIDVNWKVGSEYNLSHYVLERSEDAQLFEQISVLQGVGNTNIEQDYYYLDNDVRYHQKYYYRIKSVDVNGSYEYSPVVVASITNGISDQMDMTVYPNPADENFNVMIQLESDMNASLTVTNALGQIILHKNDHFSAGSTVSIMNSSNWVRGIYFVEFKDSETSNKIVKKIVIQ